MTVPVADRPALEVGDVIRAHGAAFRAKYGGLLSATQHKALRDLAACRTAALGGHVAHCLDCGRDRIAYNSCRNRHCPKCQALARARWLAREAEHLLPVEYHHVVFTLPGELSDLALANRPVLYDLLFQAAAATLRVVAANPKRLGAMLGVLLALHTWGQTLQHHPHVHGVVTGGGLSCGADGVVDDAPRWVSCRPGFLLPVRVLSRVFRGKFLDGLRTAFAQGKLVFPGRLAALAVPAAFGSFTSSLGGKEWVVYSKPPFGGPQQVLKYLARYTHRVALSNSRLVSLEGGRVTFRYQDYADGARRAAFGAENRAGPPAGDRRSHSGEGGTRWKKALRLGQRRSTMARTRGGSESKAHSRRARGSVQRGSIPHAPLACRGGGSTSTPAEHAG